MKRKIIKSMADLDETQVLELFHDFNSPIMTLDCGSKCSPHNPSGKPFCCDICHAVPAAYASEWRLFRHRTALWHLYRGDECSEHPGKDHAVSSLPKGMVLLACLGPQRCQRRYRALSCRQFPFFPYLTSDGRFLGLACEWEFEECCWVMSHLGRVTAAYRREFVRIHDRLFALFQDMFDNYGYHSHRLRASHARKGRRFALLHRNGGYYLVSPQSERLQRVAPSQAAALRKFGPYRGR
jgi:hypothetical protein